MTKQRDLGSENLTRPRGRPIQKRTPSISLLLFLYLPGKLWGIGMEAINMLITLNFVHWAHEKTHSFVGFELLGIPL